MTFRTSAVPNRLEWKPSPEHERRILVIVANKSSARSTGGFRLVLVPFREQARQPVTCALERPGLDSGTKLTKPDSAQGSLSMVCVIPCHSGKPLYRETMPCSIHGYPATSQAEDSASAERRVDRPLPFDPVMIRSTPVRLTTLKRTGGKTAARRSI